MWVKIGGGRVNLDHVVTLRTYNADPTYVIQAYVVPVVGGTSASVPSGYSNPYVLELEGSDGGYYDTEADARAAIDALLANGA